MSSKADQARDERLRRQLLLTLHLARGMSPTGGLSGTRLKVESDGGFGEDLEFESDGHFIQLCRDLKNHGLIEETPLNNRRRGETFGPQHVTFSITAKGTQLIEEKIPPIAGIDDERIVES
jgi:hypothetical protein